MNEQTFYDIAMDWLLSKEKKEEQTFDTCSEEPEKKKKRQHMLCDSLYEILYRLT